MIVAVSSVKRRKLYFFKIRVEEVPVPHAGFGEVVIRITFPTISPG